MGLLAVGVVFFAFGMWGIHFVGRRQFYRRNEAGLEEFKSYGSAVASNTFEGLIKLASYAALFIGLVLAIVGIVVMAH